MRGRRNPDKPTTTNVLPPCRVCGERGTGYHYGVTTCVACKGFFRRSLQRSESYVCIKSRLCLVGPSINRRQSCPKCRYDKCIAVGMSKEACKTGRYSMDKKANDWKEVMREHEADSPHTVQNTSKSLQLQHPQHAESGMVLSSEGRLDLSLKRDQLENTSDVSACSQDEGDGSAFQRKCNNMISHKRKHDEDDDLYHDESRSCGNITGSDCDQDDFLLNISADNNLASGWSMNKDITGDVNYALNKTKQELDTYSPSAPSFNVFQSPSSYNGVLPWIDSNSETDKTWSSASSSAGIRRLGMIDENVDLTPFHSPTYPTAVPTWGSPLQNTSSIASTGHFLSSSDKILSQHFDQLTSVTSHNTSFPDNSLKNMDIQIRTPDSTIETSPLQYSADFRTAHNDLKTTCNGISNEMLLSKDKISNSMRTNLDHSSIPDIPDIFSTNNDCMNGDIHSSIHPVSGIHQNNSKNNNDDESSTKKATFSKSTQSTFENSKALVPLLRGDNDNGKPKPFALFLVAPNSFRNTLSIFERLPFISFEQRSLAPLLKHLYDEDDFPGDYLTQHPTQQDHNRRGIEYGSQVPDTTPTFQTNSISTFGQSRSPTLPSYGHDFSYDAAEMDKLYGHVQDIHQRYYGPMSDQLSSTEIKSLVEKFQKICEIQETLQGNLKFIDDDKYDNIIETTGIDVDKRKEWFSATFNNFDAVFAKDIKFFRALPGFRDFRLRDKLILAKSTAMLSTLIREYQGVDTDKDVCIEIGLGTAYRFSTALRMFPGCTFVMDEYHKVTKAMKDMNITNEELMILKVLVLFFPEYCEECVEDMELLLEWNKTYLSCLLHHLRKTLGPVLGGHRFSQFVDILQLLKEKAEIAKEAIISSKGPLKRLIGTGNDHPLITEMYLSEPTTSSLGVKEPA